MLQKAVSSLAIQHVPLANLVLGVSTRNPATKPDDKFTYVDLSAVDQERKVIIGARVLVGSDAPSRARQVISTDDVLVSTVRPNLNGVARVPDQYDDAIASTGFCVLRPKKEFLDPLYLFYWVRSPTFAAEMTRRATGASYPAVSDRIVQQSLIPLPSLHEQRRIAAILDQADALRTKRREALAKLDEMAQAIFVETFGHLAAKDGLAFGEGVEEFRYGTSNKSGDSGFPTLRIPNVVGGIIDLGDTKRVEVTQAELRRLRLEIGDVLFVRTNGNPNYVGRCAVFTKSLVTDSSYAPETFIFASYLIRARLKLNVFDPVFVRSYLSSHDGRMQLREVAKTSAGQFNVNIDGLSSLKLPRATLEQQKFYTKRMEVLESIKTEHSQQLNTLDALFSSLQHRAFSGSL
ncbi:MULTISPECIES: restriction endonuclease subunit S [Acidiphilium]|uniref:Type I restriction enzyme, S subunit n=1 Tax=Acidiphilium rubrum TaxID=526 RepID=A0A8G2FF50_ACIRU|nr:MULTISPECIES: restriction endonuclease subunit S [Acidiphilium]SIR52899.1 type I restriction enzyme, S subunit [Acidiphilium rubrum]